MKRTVVIVDDHARFRRSARALLELEDFVVIGEADDGKSGLEVVAQLRPDVVLLDIALPDANGIDLAALLASEATSVVLVSSRDPVDLGARVVHSGALGFIAKDALSGEALATLLGRAS